VNKSKLSGGRRLQWEGYYCANSFEDMHISRISEGPSFNC